MLSGNILDKFPQAQQALQDSPKIQALLFTIGGAQGMDDIPARIAQIIDENVSASAIEKDAMAVCALYMFDTNAMFQRVEMFADRYSAQAQEYALHLIIARGNGENFSPEVAAIAATVNIVMMEQFIRLVKEENISPPLEEIDEEKKLTDEAVNYIYPLLRDASLKDLLREGHAAHKAVINALYDNELGRQNPDLGPSNKGPKPSSP